MSEPAFTSGHYRIVSLTKHSPVGIREPGPGDDQPLRLRQPHNIFTIKHVHDGYNIAIAGYPYTGVVPRVPGVPVIATDRKDEQVTWKIVPEKDNSYAIKASFNEEILWTVQYESDPESQIVDDPRQAGPPPTQLFKITRVD